MAYEGILALGVLIVGWLLPHTLLGVGFQLIVPRWLSLIHFVLLLGVYFIWCWYRGGQTLAMQTWNIRLTGVRTGPPSLARLTFRYLLAWPSLGCLGAGVLWAVFDRNHQFLHDRLAGTQLVMRGT